jgi:hypothetical protein
MSQTGQPIVWVFELDYLRETRILQHDFNLSQTYFRFSPLVFPSSLSFIPSFELLDLIMYLSDSATIVSHQKRAKPS